MKCIVCGRDAEKGCGLCAKIGVENIWYCSPDCAKIGQCIRYFTKKTREPDIGAL